MIKYLIAAASAALIAPGAMAAGPQDRHDDVDVSVFVLPVHQSDLTDMRGLRARINRAIDEGCGVYSFAGFDQWREMGRCRRNAKVKSERQIEALLARKSPQQVAAAR